MTGTAAGGTAEKEAEAVIERPDDPVLDAWDVAPVDDEAFTAEDLAATDAGWEEYLRGESSSLEGVRRRLLGEDEAARRTAD